MNKPTIFGCKSPLRWTWTAWSIQGAATQPLISYQTSVDSKACLLSSLSYFLLRGTLTQLITLWQPSFTKWKNRTKIRLITTATKIWKWAVSPIADNTCSRGSVVAFRAVTVVIGRSGPLQRLETSLSKKWTSLNSSNRCATSTRPFRSCSHQKLSWLFKSRLASWSLILIKKVMLMKAKKRSKIERVSLLLKMMIQVRLS